MKFNEENILLTCEAKNKIELLTIVSNYAKEMDIVENGQQVLADFIEREKEGGTGFQDGFAIPHAKSDVVKKATVFYVRNQTVLTDWETFDDQGVQHVFALLVPKSEQGTVHIHMLSQLATALMEEEFKEKIVKLTDPKEIVTLIKKEMNGE